MTDEVLTQVHAFLKNQSAEFTQWLIHSQKLHGDIKMNDINDKILVDRKKFEQLMMDITRLDMMSTDLITRIPLLFKKDNPQEFCECEKPNKLTILHGTKSICSQCNKFHNPADCDFIHANKEKISFCECAHSGAIVYDIKSSSCINCKKPINLLYFQMKLEPSNQQEKISLEECVKKDINNQSLTGFSSNPFVCDRCRTVVKLHYIELDRQDKLAKIEAEAERLYSAYSDAVRKRGFSCVKIDTDWQAVAKDVLERRQEKLS